MRHPCIATVLAAALVVVAAAATAAPTGKPVFTDPTAADEDFAFQGEYAGSTPGNEKVGVQVVALGDGKFDAVAYRGGLPGAGWTPPEKTRGTGTRAGSGTTAVVTIEGVDWGGTQRKAEIRGGVFVLLGADGTPVATLPKVVRAVAAADPPEGAIVLCDGPGPVDENTTLVKPRMTEDGLLMEGVSTKESFGDATWHIEFRLPYQPHDRGQARGNSGAYFLGAYEVQMLDSFGLDGKNDECGGIYSVAAPRVNMCLPPLTWQAYDVDVTAPRFEGGRKVADARLTVRHNGVLIHEDLAVPRITPAGTQKHEAPTGPLHLQNHGNPVRYRTIWVVPKS